MISLERKEISKALIKLFQKRLSDRKIKINQRNSISLASNNLPVRENMRMFIRHYAIQGYFLYHLILMKQQLRIIFHRINQ